LIALLHRFLSIALLCLLVATAQGQQFNFRNYSAKDGLSSSNINGVFQDSKGFLWFATQGGGISRFDGKNFRNYSKKDGLISNTATIIREDQSGNLWIGSDKGLSKYDGQAFFNYDSAIGFPESTVYGLHVDNLGRVLVGYRNEGIRIIDSTSVDSLTNYHGLPANRVYAICQDNANNFWISTSSGICLYDGSEITTFDTVEALEGKRFFSLLLDNNGAIWLGGIFCGIVKYESDEFKELDLPAGLGNDLVGGITQSNDGNIWFAIDHGLLEFDGNDYKLYTEKEGLPTNVCNAVVTDYLGNVWAGTQGGGATVFNHAPFVNYGERDGLVGGAVNCISIDSLTNTMFIGTHGNGIFFTELSDELMLMPLLGVPELENANVHSIHIVNDKQLLIGTKTGVFVVERSGSELTLSQQSSDRLRNNLPTVLDINMGVNGEYLASSFGGGTAVISKDLNDVKVIAGINTSNILTTHVQHEKIWIGTLDDGLYLLDGQDSTANKFEIHFRQPGEAIWSICDDGGNRLFLGTGENGLAIIHGDSLSWVNVKNGLCSDRINALVWSKSENCLWVGSESGVNRIWFKSNGSNIKKIETFTERDGFHSYELNHNAITLYQNKCWLGSVHGLSEYNGKLDKETKVENLKIYISTVELESRTIDIGFEQESLTLPYKENDIAFNFQALTTDDIWYSYRLLGANDKWSTLTNNTKINYSNISPGSDYVFQVRAVDDAGNVSEHLAEFSFEIKPPWWQTWWFRLLAVAFALFVIYSIIKIRERALRERNMQLEKTVAERTAEVVEEKKKVEKQNEEIVASITYAKKLQTAVLPPARIVKEYFASSFLLYLPRDIISGDFYWMENKGSVTYFAVADCTGHGVPGAMLSVIGINGLNRALNEQGLTAPMDILTSLSEHVERHFEQSETMVRDGMDISLCALDNDSKTLVFSGANNPAWIARNGEMLVLNADRRAIGHHNADTKFTQQEFQLQDGDTIYLSSDGYQDQLGGSKTRKLMKKVFREKLLAITEEPLDKQRETLLSDLESWKGDHHQTDDICVMGIRV